MRFSRAETSSKIPPWKFQNSTIKVPKFLRKSSPITKSHTKHIQSAATGKTAPSQEKFQNSSVKVRKFFQNSYRGTFLASISRAERHSKIMGGRDVWDRSKTTWARAPRAAPRARAESATQAQTMTSTWHPRGARRSHKRWATHAGKGLGQAPQRSLAPLSSSSTRKFKNSSGFHLHPQTKAKREYHCLL